MTSIDTRCYSRPRENADARPAGDLPSAQDWLPRPSPTRRSARRTDSGAHLVNARRLRSTPVCCPTPGPVRCPTSAAVRVRLRVPVHAPVVVRPPATAHPGRRPPSSSVATAGGTHRRQPIQIIVDFSIFCLLCFEDGDDSVRRPHGSSRTSSKWNVAAAGDFSIFCFLLGFWTLKKKLCSAGETILL
jgi:hypothetical protein